MEVQVEVELSKWINNSINSKMDMLNGSKLRKQGVISDAVELDLERWQQSVVFL